MNAADLGTVSADDAGRIADRAGELLGRWLDRATVLAVAQAMAEMLGGAEPAPTPPRRDHSAATLSGAVDYAEFVSIVNHQGDIRSAWFDGFDEAVAYHERAALQWTEQYLLAVVVGPGPRGVAALAEYHDRRAARGIRPSPLGRAHDDGGAPTD